MAFHQYAGASAHEHFFHSPLPALLNGLRTDPQRTRRMPESHGLALAAPGSAIDQGAGDGRSRADGHCCGAHHRMMQFTHGQRPYDQIDVAG